MKFILNKVHVFGDAVKPALVFHLWFENKRDQNGHLAAWREEIGQTGISQGKEKVLVTPKEGGQLQHGRPTPAQDTEDTV